MSKRRDTLPATHYCTKKSLTTNTHITAICRRKVSFRYGFYTYDIKETTCKSCKRIYNNLKMTSCKYVIQGINSPNLLLPGTYICKIKDVLLEVSENDQVLVLLLDNVEKI